MVLLVILLVNGNLGAGVAVAGAFSLVRFRSAPGSARDIMAIFLAMTVGLCCGMGGMGGMDRPSMNNTKAEKSPPS